MIVIGIEGPAVLDAMTATISAKVGQGVENFHAAARTRGILRGPDEGLALVVLGKGNGYESPFTDISQQGPEALFLPVRVTEMIQVLDEIRERAVA
jgi:hypothetical protein